MCELQLTCLMVVFAESRIIFCKLENHFKWCDWCCWLHEMSKMVFAAFDCADLHAFWVSNTKKPIMEQNWRGECYSNNGRKNIYSRLSKTIRRFLLCFGSIHCSTGNCFIKRIVIRYQCEYEYLWKLVKGHEFSCIYVISMSVYKVILN